jgi:hypothetical protein
LSFERDARLSVSMIRSPHPAAHESGSADRPSRIGSADTDAVLLREPAIHGRDCTPDAQASDEQIVLALVGLDPISVHALAHIDLLTGGGRSC